jgi:hypothetical protein
MPPRKRRYSIEELARRGHDLYEQRIRPQLEPQHHGKIVAIDIETGAFELGDTGLAAAERLIAKNPDAQIWCERIGYPAVHQFRSPSRSTL